jgi:pilus assembly protein CpaB
MVAQSLGGKISLALRSLADSSVELERAVASGDVQVPEGTNPADERRMMLAVANQPSDKNTTYTTGGDVSRFQRRTVPARKSEAVAAAAGPPAALGPTGPVVRVSRGNNVTVVPVGAR